MTKPSHATIAIVIAPERLPQIIEQTDGPDALLAALRAYAGTIDDAPDLPDLIAARTWLDDQPAPAGLYATRAAATAAAHKATRTTPPPDQISKQLVFETRQALGLSRREFGRALGYGGNDNTVNKSVLDIERGKKNFGAAAAAAFVRLRAKAALVDGHGSQ
jgi:hypothetical protein